MQLYAQLSKCPTHKKLSHDGSNIKTVSKLGNVMWKRRMHMGYWRESHKEDQDVGGWIILK
jgi:hypothetical protein